MAPAQRRGQTARRGVGTDQHGAAQAQRGAGHVVRAALAVQGGGAARLLEVARADLVPGHARKGFNRVGVAQRKLVAEFGEHLRRRGVIGRLQALVHAAKRHIALGVDLVPGVGRARREAELPRAGFEVLAAEDRCRVAVDAHARRHVGDGVVAAGIAERAAQAPAVAHGAVAADKETARGLVHGGCVAVTAEGAPVAERLCPDGRCAALRQGIGRRCAQLGSRTSGGHGRVEVAAQVRHRQRPHRVALPLQHAAGAGVRFAGKLLQGRTRLVRRHGKYRRRHLAGARGLGCAVAAGNQGRIGAGHNGIRAGGRGAGAGGGRSVAGRCGAVAG
ncbi:hypothetical protein D3C87_1319180 [compost metagenome]